jgi:MAGE family
MPWFGAGAYNAMKCKHDKIRKVARRGSFEFRAISGTGSNLACAQYLLLCLETSKAHNNNSSTMVKADKRRRVVDSDDEEDEEETAVAMTFSSQAPEMTQEIPQVKEFERAKLMEMSENQREKAITDLTRIVLFNALAGHAIDRTKCIKEAGISDARISSAAFDEVNIRLSNCFGFEVKRLPAWMENIKGISKTMKERYYVTNALNDADEMHGKALHSVHEQSSIEKGLLMVILGFIYCKGEPRNDGSRWLHDKDLYSLLHRLDENMPSEPPAAGKRAKSASQISSRFVGGTGAAQTPDVDAFLHKFVQRDYLIKEKATMKQQQECADVDEDSLFYTMGPRAAIEVGRRQVIFFCGEILDLEPDPTMLQELEAMTGDAEME